MRNIAVFCSLLGLFVLVSCERKSPEEKELKQAKGQVAKEYFSRYERIEKIPLLALKYGVSEHVVEKIVDLHAAPDLLEFWPEFKKASTIEEVKALEKKVMRPPITQTVSAISKEFNIPPEKVASIVIDYKILIAVERAASSEQVSQE